MRVIFVIEHFRRTDFPTLLRVILFRRNSKKFLFTFSDFSPAFLALFQVFSVISTLFSRAIFSTTFIPCSSLLFVNNHLGDSGTIRTKIREGMARMDETNLKTFNFRS